MVHTLITDSEHATHEVGSALGSMARPGDVVLLCGDLGAGKTVLTKGLAMGLGVAESVTSPTFNILLVHEGRIPLYHFDLYRLERAEELEDIDYFGTLEGDGISVVEWGDRFPGSEPVDFVRVSLSIEGDSSRRLIIEPGGPRGKHLAAQWSAACADVDGVTLDTNR